MNAKDLAAELDASFQSAARALFESDDYNEGKKPISEYIQPLLRACANNAAQALADRAISSDEADELAAHGAGTLDEYVTSLIESLCELDESSKPEETK